MDSALATNPTFQTLQKGCQQGKVDKKGSPPKVQLKNGTIFDMDTKK
jgi:hypothetical protein